MIVKNKTVRVIILGKVKLLPGMNDVSEENYKANEKKFQKHLKLRNIELPKLEIEDDLEDGISAYKAADAISLIEETHDEDVLKGYLEDEKSSKNRKSVIEAIEKKIEEAHDALNDESEE